MGISLGGILDNYANSRPERAELLELHARLEEIAPALVRWRHMAEPKGPRPDVHPRHRAEVERIEERGRELVRAMTAATTPPRR